MKLIRGHFSRDMGEIVDILRKQGNFTCPTLPHYRYNRVKENCRMLRRLSLVAVSGGTEESVNLVASDKFRLWQTELESGATALGVIKWAKQKNRESVK